jgi:hypothetical protein
MAHFFFVAKVQSFCKKKKQWMATLQNHIILNFFIFLFGKILPPIQRS